MSSEFRKSFKEGFILDETVLRKLREIIKDRVDEQAIKFSLKRVDGFSYRTENLEELISKEESSWVAIESISVVSSGDNAMRLDFSKGDSLRYDYDKGVKLMISGSDRDKVNLLGDDLTKYLETAVLTKNIKWSNYLAIFFAFLLCAAAAFTYVELQSDMFEILDLTVEPYISFSDSQKLDYLVHLINEQNTSKRSGGHVVFISFGLLFLLLITAFSEFGDLKRIISRFFPKYVFLFSQEAIDYNKIKTLKKNVVWVVIIGSLISIVSGFVVYFMTSAP